MNASMDFSTEVNVNEDSAIPFIEKTFQPHVIK